MQALRRSTITRRSFSIAALLAISLKVLVPVGFMVDSVDGHARLVLCPAGIHVQGMAHDMRSGMAMAMVDPHAMHMLLEHGNVHAAHGVASASQCPFAQATGGALHAQLPQLAAPYSAILQPVAPAAFVSVPRDPPLRHVAPRGPPSFA